MIKHLLVLISFATLISCSTDGMDTVAENNPDETPIATELYFPSTTSAEWETLSETELNWNTNTGTELQTYLEEQNTKAFIILKNGKIVNEWYFNNFEADDSWYWASAGKTLTAFTVGIAQEKGYLDIADKTSDYLGTGWTSLTKEQEDKITIENQLTMTSGMDENAFTCVSSDCLNYIADAGNRWAYHNGPYTLLQDVVANATATNYNLFFNTELKSRIGMDGFWLNTEATNNVYFSTARSMARFGLLILNKGTWAGDPILEDQAFFEAMTTSSQNLNPAYGYLWWLNGKSTYMLPSSQELFNGSLITTVPNDLIAALGKNDQKLYVVPSENLVIIRLGDAANAENFALSTFDTDLWQLLSTYMGLD